MKTVYEMLSEARISASTDVPKREFLFTWNGTPCFPRGELVALTGKDSDTRIFTLTQTATRKYDIPSRLNFTVTSDGLPADTFTPEPDNTSATTSGTATATAGMRDNQ